MLYLAFDPAPSERGYNHYSTFVYPEEVQALTEVSPPHGDEWLLGSAGTPRMTAPRSGRATGQWLAFC